MIAGLILAAGEGTRYGDQPKLLATLDGRSLLEHAVRAQCAVPELDRIVVVLGAHSQQLLAGVQFLRAEQVICENWRDGQAASLRCGAAALAGSSKVLVTLGDEPLITPELIARFTSEPAGARAVYRGRPGHPVVFGPEHLEAIAALSGDRGARELLGYGPEIECGDLCSGRDVDTPEDLEAISHEELASRLLQIARALK